MTEPHNPPPAATEGQSHGINAGGALKMGAILGGIFMLIGALFGSPEIGAMIGLAIGGVAGAMGFGSGEGGIMGSIKGLFGGSKKTASAQVQQAPQPEMIPGVPVGMDIESPNVPDARSRHGILRN